MSKPKTARPEKPKSYFVVKDGPAGRHGRVIRLLPSEVTKLPDGHVRPAKKREIALAGHLPG